MSNFDVAVLKMACVIATVSIVYYYTFIALGDKTTREKSEESNKVFDIRNLAIKQFNL